MPCFANGTTTFQVLSHLVAPSASAASRWSCGTASSTCRDTDTMNGRIITASTMPAESMLTP